MGFSKELGMIGERSTLVVEYGNGGSSAERDIFTEASKRHED